MRQKIYLLAVALATLLQSQAALAQDTQADAVTQLQFGRQVVTVPADASLTFYDPKGTGSISSTSTNNTHEYDDQITIEAPEEPEQDSIDWVLVACVVLVIVVLAIVIWRFML